MITAKKSETKRGGTKNRAPNKKDAYMRFVQWSAWTSQMRKDNGLPTVTSFCEKYGINIDTTTDWKKRADFAQLKREAQIEWLGDATSDVLAGLKDRCVKYGMAYDVELYLLYVEGWDRKRVIELMGEVKLGNNDLRAVIDLLPEHKRTKFYGLLTELVAEAEAIRNVGSA